MQYPDEIQVRKWVNGQITLAPRYDFAVAGIMKPLIIRPSIALLCCLHADGTYQEFGRADAQKRADVRQAIRDCVLPRGADSRYEESFGGDSLDTWDIGSRTALSYRVPACVYVASVTLHPGKEQHRFVAFAAVRPPKHYGGFRR